MSWQGAFSGRSWWGFAWYVMPKEPAQKIEKNTNPGLDIGRNRKTLVSRETAALIVYPTMIAAWVFLAGGPSFEQSWPILSLLALVVAIVAGLTGLKAGASKVLSYRCGQAEAEKTRSGSPGSSEEKTPTDGAVRSRLRIVVTGTLLLALVVAFAADVVGFKGRRMRQIQSRVNRRRPV
jgi:hypothetical protein